MRSRAPMRAVLVGVAPIIASRPQLVAHQVTQVKRQSLTQVQGMRARRLYARAVVRCRTAVPAIAALAQTPPSLRVCSMSLGASPQHPSSTIPLTTRALLTAPTDSGLSSGIADVALRHPGSEPRRAPLLAARQVDAAALLLGVRRRRRAEPLQAGEHL